MFAFVRLGARPVIRVISHRPISTSIQLSNSSDKPRPVAACDSCPTATGVCGPPPPPQSNLKYLIAAGLAIGGATLAYYLYGMDDDDDPAQKKPKRRPLRKPENPAQIPKEIAYLLIGGGTASFSAFRAIKSNDPRAKVLVITNEDRMPYMRPPLSKELWYSDDVSDTLKFKQWNGQQRSLFFEPEEYYSDVAELPESENGGISVCTGYTVEKIDPTNRIATLSDGHEIKYGECLIATGASPKNLDVFESAPIPIQEKISQFKTIEDYQHLKQMLEKAQTVAIVGGGFVGSELSCALARYGKGGKSSSNGDVNSILQDEKPNKLKVYQIFHETGNMGKILPEYLSLWTTERVKEEGVNIISKSQVTSVEAHDDKVKLNLIDGLHIIVDHVIVAIGSEPNTELANASNLEVDGHIGGFVVNAELEARSHLYVAGDAACFYDPKFGRRRVEHHDHAVVSGRLAGENMVGLKKPYTHQSMFWSDLGPKIGYEAIGIVDASLPTVGVFARSTPNDVPASNRVDKLIGAKPAPEDAEGKVEKPATAINVNNSNSNETAGTEDYGKGVIFYLKKDRVVGIVLWNVFNRINLARKVLAQETKFDDLNEVAKLFTLHD